ncbi:hypothetical protein GWI33_014233 [Rhynchophorus ferrugineus]|uniref:Hepatocyte growth factor-regulated tyrosine kinase substrate n=2 Tax=Rhynchophorus ferrugineus TaxID=354439 RepID=A0A834IFI9_RHYFE|nr:hypothetical protein GWI33_014233 [Rhynchophorus ferrugineus]
MFRKTFDNLLDKATSHLLIEPDWPTTIQLCDYIRQNDIQPKNALTAIRKKLSAPNPYSAYYALLVLESVVKNCGSIVHEEVTSKSYCEFLSDLVKTTEHANIRQKLLELIQVWNFAFRKNPKYTHIKDLMTQLTNEGYKFPVLQESDAMFAADTAPEWADGEVCHRCRVQFGIVQRKHHCRACGQIFCHGCSSKTSTVPKFGIEKEVRVCNMCYDALNKTSTSKSSKAETDLPPEYLKSSLAQQSQEPPRKSEEEIREEEDLQLALALSQSEAEAKEKEKLRATSVLLNTYKTAPEPTTNRSPSPQEEPTTNPELDRYLNRSYWESVQSQETSDRPMSPSAPSPASSIQSNEPKFRLKENGVTDNDLEEFIKTLKSQVEIFINRMKSNSSRGRSIANDTSVQTLFMNTTNLHSRLLKYIQEHDDRRLYYERLQDKLTQVKDARAALDALREEHREKLRREAEEAERQRQMQMAHKLEIMRKKKQEYLQYQRQLALQRIQEQEREMQMRQEQQKQQYLIGPQQFPFMGSPVHAPQFQQPNNPPVGGYYMQYGQMLPQGPNPPNPGIPPTSQGPSGLPQGPQINQPQTQIGGPPQQFIPPNVGPNNPPPSGTFSPPPGMMGVHPAGIIPGPTPRSVPGGQPPAAIDQQAQMPFLNQGTTVQPPQQVAPQHQPNGEQTQTAELISFD